MGLDTFNDGVFSDVVVEVQNIPSYAPYQDFFDLNYLRSWLSQILSRGIKNV